MSIRHCKSANSLEKQGFRNAILALRDSVRTPVCEANYAARCRQLHRDRSIQFFWVRIRQDNFNMQTRTYAKYVF